jgi:serine O-acetyltransferase
MTPKYFDTAEYVKNQINNFFPDQYPIKREDLLLDVDEAFGRTLHCINHVSAWEKNKFNYLHSSQYCTFLWYLSNSIWRNRKNENLCTKIFYLNKTLNGFECFYDNHLPEVFFIGHTVGIVLVRNTYRNHLVLYQGVTVGKSFDHTPSIGERVILYPNTAVIGNSEIKDDCVVSQGVSLINKTIGPKNIVFSNGSEIVTKPHDGSIIDRYFRG